MENLRIKAQSVCRPALAAFFALFTVLYCSSRNSGTAEFDSFFTGETSYGLHSLLYVQEQGSFVATGSDGYRGIIFKSTNGKNWKQINTKSIEESLSDLPSLLLRYYPISSLAFGEGHYIITGQRGMLYVSSDAQNWRPVPSRSDKTPITNNLHQIIYAQNRFVAVGEGVPLALLMILQGASHV